MLVVGKLVQVRRYQAPDEQAFFPEGLPQPILPSLVNPKVATSSMLAI